MNKAELLEAIREAYEERRKLQAYIDDLNRRLDDMETEEAGREYLKAEEILSTFAV